MPKALTEILSMYKPIFAFKKRSFSQCGEDIILDNLFRRLKVGRRIKYIDIGANHPFSLSNTAFFYFNNVPKGGGILVEPNPCLYEFLKKKRNKDIVLNTGILGKKNRGILPFYIMNNHVLSSFSKKEVSEYEKKGYKIEKIIDVKVENINNIFKKYFSHGNIDLMNLDTEGLDYEILSSINYKLYRPKVICVETIDFGSEILEKKQSKVIEVLLAKGYFIYGETGINTIFLDKDILSSYDSVI